MQPIQGERRRRAGQKHRLCAAADTAGVRGGLSTHYAAFIYDAGLTEGYCILGIRVTDYTGKVSETDTESGAVNV